MRDQLNVGGHLRKIMTLTLKESIKRFAFIENFHRNFIEKPLETEEPFETNLLTNLLRLVLVYYGASQLAKW